MDIEKFKSTSIAILRTGVGWQSAIARRLNVSSRSIRYWLKSGKVPEWVDAALNEMIRVNQNTPWPRDEWLIGGEKTTAGDRREHIVHLQEPRFVARIVIINDDGYPDEKEIPVDTTAGVVYQISENEIFCEIEWIDPVRPGEHVKWLEAAAEKIIKSRDRVHKSRQD